MKSVAKVFICTFGTILTLLVGTFQPFSNSPSNNYSTTTDPYKIAQANLIEQFDRYQSGELFSFNIEEDLVNGIIYNFLVEQEIIKFNESYDNNIYSVLGVWTEVNRGRLSLKIHTEVSYFKTQAEIQFSIKETLPSQRSFESLGAFIFTLEKARIGNVSLPLSIGNLLLKAVSSEELMVINSFLSINLYNNQIILDKAQLINHLIEDSSTSVIATIASLIWEKELVKLDVRERDLSIAVALKQLLVSEDTMRPEEISDENMFNSNGYLNRFELSTLILNTSMNYYFNKAVDQEHNYVFPTELINKYVFTKLNAFESYRFKVEGKTMGIDSLWFETTEDTFTIKTLIVLGRHKSLVTINFSIANQDSNLVLSYKSGYIGSQNNNIEINANNAKGIINILDSVLPFIEINEDSQICVSTQKIEELINMFLNEYQVSASKIIITENGIELIIESISLDNAINIIKDKINAIIIEISANDVLDTKTISTIVNALTEFEQNGFISSKTINSAIDDLSSKELEVFKSIVEKIVFIK